MRGPLNWYRGATKGKRPRRVSVPTLYIWGRHDPFLGRKAAELTGKYVTGPYRFEEIKAGHWIIDRNAEELQRMLGEHLEDFGVRRRARITGDGAPRRQVRAGPQARPSGPPSRRAAKASQRHGKGRTGRHRPA